MGRCCKGAQALYSSRVRLALDPCGRLLTRCITSTNDITEETGMSFEYLADPSRPAWAGVLPGKPEAYFLSKGEGEHAKLFTDTFAVLLRR